MARWDYELKCGKDLRLAIDVEDGYCVLEELRHGYEELVHARLLDPVLAETYISLLEEVDYDDADCVNYELRDFYDLCDNIGVWIPLVG